MSRNIKIVAAVLAAATFNPAFAYETSWFDRKADEKEGQSAFKADGTIFAAYERPDTEANGVIDGSGARPSNPPGFILSRAYFNLRGEVNEGAWKARQDSRGRCSCAPFMSFERVIPICSAECAVKRRTFTVCDITAARDSGTDIFLACRDVGQDQFSEWSA